MTSQKDKIQTLIEEIELTLNRASPLLPWVMSGEVNKQRDVLARAQTYLKSLQQVFDAPDGWGPIDPQTGQLATSTQHVTAKTSEESAASVLQALLIEMRYLRENSLKPMRLEIETLSKQRTTLQSEIATLEAQRLVPTTQPNQQQINDFLETLIERLQANLSNQVASALAKLEADRANELILQQTDTDELGAAEQPRLHPSERLDQLRLVQAQSDQLLLKLDSTLQTVFESLQKSVDSYKDSLADGLDQMHGLGRQGEVIFHALVNHLAQQLGQDTSLYLNSGLGLEGSNDQPQRIDLPTKPSTDTETEDTPPPQDALEQVIDNLDLDLDLLEEQDLTIIQVDDSLTLPDVDELSDESLNNTDLDDSSGLSLDSGPITVIQDDLTSIKDLDENDLDLLSESGFDPITEITVEAPHPEETLEEFYEDMFGEDAPDPEQLIEVDQQLTQAEAEFKPASMIDDLLGDGLLEIPSDELEVPEAEVPEASDEAISNFNGASDEAAFEIPDINTAPEIDALLFDDDSFGASEASLDTVSTSLTSEDNETIDDLFGPGMDDAPDGEIEDAPPSDTIESLAELLPDIIDSNTLDPLGDFGEIDSLGASEDREFGGSPDTYIPAPAGENLLDTESPIEEQRLTLELENDLVDQLNSDLEQMGEEDLDIFADLSLDDAGLDGIIEDPLAEDPLAEDSLAFDQNTLENLVADLDLSEDSELDSTLSTNNDLTDLATSVLASDDLEPSFPMASDPLETATGETASIDVVSLEELSDELSLNDFIPDSAELPPLEEGLSSAEGLDTDPLEIAGAETESLFDHPPLIELDDMDEDEDLGLAGLADSLGDLGNPLNADLPTTTDLENLTLADLLPDAMPESGIMPEIRSENSPENSLTTPELVEEIVPDFDLAIGLEDPHERDEVSTQASDTEASDTDGTAIMPDVPEDDDDDNAMFEETLPPTTDPIETDLLTDLDPLETLSPLLDQAADDPFEVGPMLEGLPEELATLSQEADQKLPMELLGDLVSDLEEPLLCDGPLPDIPTINEETPNLESSLLPDKPTETLAAIETDLRMDSLAVAPLTETETASDLFSDFDTAEIGMDDTLDAAGEVPTDIEVEPDTGQPIWFLGIDLGTTGLSAVLLDQSSGQVYPIYWLASETTGLEKNFRLPMAAWWGNNNQITAVGYDAWQQAAQQHQSPGTPPGTLLKQLKPLMKISVPHGQSHPSGEPLLQWSDQQTVSMTWVQQAIELSLKQLIPEPGESTSCGTVGLEETALQAAINQLKGIIIGYPTNWPDTYSLNIREAVLAADLVTDPNQIFFIEDAIATVLSGLPDPQSLTAEQTTALSRQPSLYNCDWEGGTVVISAGASLSELMLVDLPTQLNEISYPDFALRSFPYAGDWLDQDIICQLLYPPESRQPLSQVAAPDASQDWHWQATLPEGAAADWASLNLESLALPQPGEPDMKKRHRLAQRLESSPLGQSLVEAARHLKLILQHQSQFQLDLGLQRWLIKRRDLESRIFLPYIQRVNRHLNVLLSQKGFSAESIKQVICTGGSASLPAIARWLRQKFPNATIIQDTYAGDRPNSCSRVAYGLVNLARYPNVLDITRQQYSDFFLLMELLRVFPQQPLPVSGIMHLLEQRGINTQACHLHILALLEGHLPPGLVPTDSDRPFISNQSKNIVTYQALTEAPLFSKQSGQIYVPNEAQCRRLRAYMEQIMAEKVQTLDEPMIAQLAIETGV